MAKKVDGRRRYRAKLWGGFCDNALSVSEIDTGFGGFGAGEGMARMPAIFTSRKQARRQFQDVRAIEVRELGPTR